MSKRGSKSAIKINNAKSMSGGSGKGIATWTKKKKMKLKVTVPTSDDLDSLRILGISYISKPEELEVDKLKLLIVKKIEEVSTIDKDKTPHKLNIDIKTKKELVRMIHILQNRLIEYIKN